MTQKESRMLCLICCWYFYQFLVRVHTGSGELKWVRTSRPRSAGGARAGTAGWHAVRPLLSGPSAWGWEPPQWWISRSTRRSWPASRPYAIVRSMTFTFPLIVIECLGSNKNSFLPFPTYGITSNEFLPFQYTLRQSYSTKVFNGTMIYFNGRISS